MRRVERRILQVLLAVLSLIPLLGLAIAFGPGPAFFQPAGSPPPPVDLDNQWRYLSGVYVSVTLAIWWTLPHVETRLAPIRIASLGVMIGGIGRLVSMAQRGRPDDPAMLAGVVLELGVVPLLLLWQARLHRLHGGRGAVGTAPTTR
jgi:hypothetical protein